MKTIVSIAFLLILTTFQVGCNSNQSSEISGIDQKPFVVFLVRHAEKADLTEDPELTPAGKVRSLELAKMLRSANIDYVHSSDFIRTRETAAPTSQEFGLTTNIYDPGDLEALATMIRETGGRHLVVGHSNSTPNMVAMLGGDPGTDINEASEYDRLYIVTTSIDGQVSSVLMRYGQPFSEPISH